MLIKSLALQNFRNFSKKEYIFDKNLTVIVGPNASGKTNILEAIYLLSLGKSFKAGQDEEMIKNGEDFARVVGRVSNNSEEITLAALIARPGVLSNQFTKKQLSVNGVSRRLYNFAGNLKAVLFGPWDLELVTESPSRRRKFLDAVLSQVDREYHRSSLSYEKGIRQRNKILERIREGLATRSQLAFWDRLVIQNGDYISQAREKFIDFANTTSGIGEENFEIEYDKSGISEARLAQYTEEEVAAASTLVGPHRDDFVLKGGGKNLAAYGSRGEQRMGVLWLKLAELAFVERESGEQPVLLLDDVFSELDHHHRKIVMETVGRQQTILTTADPHTIEGLDKKAEITEL